jgi:hypothetical protein
VAPRLTGADLFDLPNSSYGKFGCSDSTALPMGSVSFAMFDTEDHSSFAMDALTDLHEVLDQYADELRLCRYGSFRGVIRDGRVVVFAIEQEWRPHLEEERKAARQTNGRAETSDLT